MIRFGLINLLLSCAFLIISYLVFGMLVSVRPSQPELKHIVTGLNGILYYTGVTFVFFMLNDIMGMFTHRFRPLPFEMQIDATPSSDGIYITKPAGNLNRKSKFMLYCFMIFCLAMTSS